MFKTVIVDELGCIRFWCNELEETQIECILNNHPEWTRVCIQC